MSAVASADRIEIVAGLPPSGRVVRNPAPDSFTDGDTVRVVDAAAVPVKSAQK